MFEAKSRGKDQVVFAADLASQDLQP